MKKIKDNDKQNKEKGFKHRELREIVIKSIGLSVLLGGTFLISPNFPIAYAGVLKLIKEFTGKKITERKVKRVLKNLERSEIIDLEKRGDEVIVQLKSWSPIVLKYSIKSLLDYKLRKKEWQRKWFLVFFDVPEKQRNKRDYLRSFLRDIGFFQYQQSVYVFPYECHEEIKLIKEVVESAKYMSYIVAEEIEFESEAKRHFNLE